jgi:hypothetical protein
MNAVQPGELIDDTSGAHSSGDVDRQTFSGKLIDDR